jgi:hypothetical protein
MEFHVFILLSLNLYNQRMLLSSMCTQITECYCLCHIAKNHIQKMCGKMFFLMKMASSNRTTDILVGQIHLADVVGIARKNIGDGDDLEDEMGRSEGGVRRVERGGSLCADDCFLELGNRSPRARRCTAWMRWCSPQPPCERL